MALSNPNTLDKICMDIVSEGRNREVLWCWLKAHVGMEGNKAADRLAKAGSNLLEIDVQAKIAANAIKTFTEKENY